MRDFEAANLPLSGAKPNTEPDLVPEGHESAQSPGSSRMARILH